MNFVSEFVCVCVCVCVRARARVCVCILKNIPKEIFMLVAVMVHRVKLFCFRREQRNVDEKFDSQSTSMKTNSQFRQQQDGLM